MESWQSLADYTGLENRRSRDGPGGSNPSLSAREECECHMMGEYNRDVSFRKAMRKKRISDHYWSSRDHSYYDNLHQYSKNKIHCSCSMCSRKTRNKGKRREKRGNYSRSLCYKASDLRRILSMDDKMRDSRWCMDPPRRRVHNW